MEICKENKVLMQGVWLSRFTTVGAVGPRRPTPFGVGSVSLVPTSCPC